ncbi:MFS transporter [Paenibacillus sp. 79R4]|uniref:MFS transporter n=1 Tax=Paenibacillus sp. 79R4 TaxID=2212847 RepID=UPI0015C16A32|nr:MFS transporter [Paenibacillus sp. 79R4]NWL86517.1 MFS transporter [Paenibacillus sp. 79R4]
MGNKLKIYMLAFLGFLAGTAEYVIAGILDQVADSTHVSVAAAGQLITIFSIGFAFGTPVFMMIAAKMERRRLLILSLVFIVIGSLMTVVLPGFSLLVVSRVILAIGAGGFVITAMTVSSNLVPPDRQGGAIATIFAGFSASLILGIPIGRVIAAAYDWKLIFLGIGILNLMGILAIIKNIPVTRAEAPAPLRQQLAFLKQPKIALALGITFFVFTGYSMLNTYMAPYLSSVMGLSELIISGIFLALGIGCLIGTKFGGTIGDRIGYGRTIIIAIVMQFLIFILLSALFSISSGPIAVTIGIMLLMIWTMVSWAFGTVQNTSLATITPEAAGIILSLNSSFVHIGVAAGAGMGGIVLDGPSVVAISWIGSIPAAIAIVISIISFKLNRSHEKEGY